MPYRTENMHMRAKRAHMRKRRIYVRGNIPVCPCSIFAHLRVATRGKTAADAPLRVSSWRGRFVALNF